MALHEPNGLLAVGGDLSAARLMAAYRQGIFPWYGEDDPILWWSPNPRTLFFPDKIHVSRSLRKFCRKSRWTITINHCFEQVIRYCGDVRAEQEGTWITEEMLAAYTNLHQRGHAHSVEVWDGDTLVGGLYGVAVGQAFCGESMFHLATNASKVALASFAEHFHQAGGQFIDCQVGNAHLTSLGAQSIPRERFLYLLHLAEQQRVAESTWKAGEIPLFGREQER